MNPPAALIDDLRLLEPPNPWLVYYWIGGALLFAICLLLLIKLIRYLKKRNAGKSTRHVQAARVDALAALQNLYGMVEAGQGKAFATESSAVMRQYLEHLFEIRAPVRSTEEFLYEIQNSPLLAEEHQELLSRFLTCCDYLKFARGVASCEELEDLYGIAVQFITETSVLDQEGQA